MFDFVHFPCKPSTYYDDGSYDENEMELIIAKGLHGDPAIVRMYAPGDITGIFMYESNK